MYFSWNYNLDDFLFENFNIHTLGVCVLSIILVFVLSFANEGIRHLQSFLNSKLKDNWLNGKGQTVENINTEESPLVSPLRIPVSSDQLKKLKLRNHAIQTILYMINLLIGFIVMLIAMDYYSGHFIALIFGYGCAYYFLNRGSDGHGKLACDEQEQDDGYYDHEGDLGPKTSGRSNYNSLDDNHDSIVI